MRKTLAVSAFVLALVFILAGCDIQLPDMSALVGTKAPEVIFVPDADTTVSAGDEAFGDLYDPNADTGVLNDTESLETIPESVADTTVSVDAEAPQEENKGDGVGVDMTAIKAEIDSKKVSDFKETTKTTEYVKLTIKDYGDVVIRLRSDVAPITVKNFQDLVKDGFYDGLTFHRIMKGFMIQGGDPKGDGTGGSGKTIKGEFRINGVQNDLSHIAGVISMARRSTPYDSATSQFFICNDDSAARSLDGKYAAFGYVVAGLDVVLTVSEVEVAAKVSGGEQSSPVEPVYIEKVCFVNPK